MECEFCKNSFNNKNSLIKHQKTARYCLKIRGEELSNNHVCEFCELNFSTQFNYNRHISTCKSNNLASEYFEKNQLLEKEILKLKTILEEKNNQIKDLQAQIEKMATTAINRPTTQNNQNNNNQRINQIINNLTPITEDHLKEQAEFLTIDHIKDGIPGYVKYALEYPLKDKIICTDYSRRKIKYKDEDGVLIDDPEMIKLTQKLFKAIEEKNDILIQEYSKEIQQKYNILMIETPNNEMNDSDTEMLEAKFNVLTKEFFNAKDRTREIKEIAKGNKNETYYEFVKDICSKTIK